MNSDRNIDGALLFELQNYISGFLRTSHKILHHGTIRLTILSLTPIFLILNHKSSLLLESKAFSKSTKHQYNLPLFAPRYLSMNLLVIKILPTVLLPLINRV